MSEEQIKESAPIVIPPIAVTVIGTEDSGIGVPLTTGTIAATPDHQPNIVVHVIPPIVAIVVRFANLYVITLTGLLTAAGATGVIKASDFWHLLLKCGGVALVPPALGMLKDLVTIFGQLEKKFPLLTGSV